MIDEVKVLLLNEMQRFSFFFFTSFSYRLSSSSFPLLLSFLSIVKDIRKRNSFGSYFPFARAMLLFYISYILNEIFFPLEPILLLMSYAKYERCKDLFFSFIRPLYNDSIQEKKNVYLLSTKVKKLKDFLRLYCPNCNYFLTPSN